MNRRKENKKQQGRASLIIMITLAFLLMAGVVILVRQLPDDGREFETQASSDALALSGFSCDSAEAESFYPFMDGIIRLTNERVTWLDILGAERVSADIRFATPYALSQPPFFLVADRDGTGYMMLTPDGVLYEGHLNGSVKGAAISKDGLVALVQDQENSTGIVTMLEAQTGRVLYDCHFPQSGYVLSVDFTHDGQFFDVSLVNTDGSALQPVIKRFQTDGTVYGQLLPDLAELYPFLIHSSRDHPILCGARNVVALSYGQGDPLWSQEYFSIEALSSGTDSLWITARERQNENLALYRVDSAGQETRVLDIGPSAVGPVVSEEYVVVASGSRLLVLDRSSNQLFDEKTLPGDIIRIGLSGNHAILVTMNGVYRYPITDK